MSSDWGVDQYLGFGGSMAYFVAPMVVPGMIVGYSVSGSNNKVSGTLLGGVAQVVLVVSILRLAPKEVSDVALYPLHYIYFDKSGGLIG
jgi:hypothetical protein